jgi:hypothetical protein
MSFFNLIKGAHPYSMAIEYANQRSTYKMRYLLMAGAMLCALVLPSKADTFTADSVSVVNGQGLTILTPTFVNTQAGEIQLHNNATNTNLLVWCIDVFDTINLPYTYQVNTFHAGDVRPGIPNLTAAQVRQIAGLALLGNGLFSDAVIQLAIWRVEYGGSFTSTASGTLLTNSTLAMTDSQVGGVLDCANCTLTVLTDAPANPSQAFAFATLAAVPGPIAGAGLPGLIAACGMLIGFAKRRRARLAA